MIWLWLLVGVGSIPLAAMIGIAAWDLWRGE